MVAAAAGGLGGPLGGLVFGPLPLGLDVAGAGIVDHLTQDGTQHELSVVDGWNGQKSRVEGGACEQAFRACESEHRTLMGCGD